jgi:hypothetical protein
MRRRCQMARPRHTLGARGFSLPAFRANASQRNIKRSHLETDRQRNVVQSGLRWNLDIRDLPALFAEKVAMLPHVRTEPAGAPIQGDLTDQSALHEYTQAVVNCRERYVRHPLPGALENLVRGRMIVTSGHDFEHFLPMPRGAESGRLQRMLEPLLKELVPRVLNPVSISGGGCVSTRRRL